MVGTEEKSSSAASLRHGGERVVHARRPSARRLGYRRGVHPVRNQHRRGGPRKQLRGTLGSLNQLMICIGILGSVIAGMVRN